MEIISAIELMIILGLIWYIKKRSDFESSLLARRIESSLELKKTMAMGLHSRFNYPTHKNDEGERYFEKGSELFLKQTPFEFERFVANLFERKFGGTCFTTSKSGDYGIDFEHKRENGLYLGQVKAYKIDMDFSPIALVHSNMVKQNAKGGYIITTGGFSKAAQEYARGLDIDLVNGIELVDYWLETMESTVYSPSSELAKTQ